MYVVTVAFATKGSTNLFQSLIDSVGRLARHSTVYLEPGTDSHASVTFVRVLEMLRMRLGCDPGSAGSAPNSISVKSK